MKWSLVVLILIGVAGALCAAVLMANYQAGKRGNSPSSTQPAEVSVVVAAKPIAAMAMIDAASVEVRKVPSAEAPKDCYRDCSSVIGRVLAMPAGAQQQLTRKMFVDAGSSRQLAAMLPSGMRAVTLAFADSAASESQLYPGCRVNVILSIKPTGEGAEPMAKTLFNGLQVLAVGERTVLSDEETSGAAKAEGARYDKRVMVTLMVSDDQANQLALATQQGKLSLSMRGPTDDSVGSNEPTLLSDLARQLRVPAERLGGRPSSAPSTSTAPAYESPRQRQWQTQVIRGSAAEVKTFLLTNSSQGM